MEDILVIEHCVDCDKHKWCTNHDEKKYRDVFEKTKYHIENECPEIMIIENQEHPSIKSTLSRKTQRVPFDKLKFPKIGSFEIYFRGTVVFSKLKTGLWPNPAAVAKTIRDAIDGIIQLSDPYSEKSKNPQKKPEVPKLSKVASQTIKTERNKKQESPKKLNPSATERVLNKNSTTELKDKKVEHTEKKPEITKPETENREKNTKNPSLIVKTESNQEVKRSSSSSSSSSSSKKRKNINSKKSLKSETVKQEENPKASLENPVPKKTDEPAVYNTSSKLEEKKDPPPNLPKTEAPVQEKPNPPPNLPKTEPNIPKTEAPVQEKPNLPKTEPNIPKTEVPVNEKPNLPKTEAPVQEKPNPQPNLPKTEPNLPKTEAPAHEKPNLPGTELPAQVKPNLPKNEAPVQENPNPPNLPNPPKLPTNPIINPPFVTKQSDEYSNKFNPENSNSSSSSSSSSKSSEKSFGRIIPPVVNYEITESFKINLSIGEGKNLKISLKNNFDSPKVFKATTQNNSLIKLTRDEYVLDPGIPQKLAFEILPQNDAGVSKGLIIVTSDSKVVYCYEIVVEI